MWRHCQAQNDYSGRPCWSRRRGVKARFVSAMSQAEAGEIVGESHVTFESWEGLLKVLTGKRLALLRHLRA